MPGRGWKLGEGAETGAVCRRIGGEYGLWVFSRGGGILGCV